MKLGAVELHPVWDAVGYLGELDYLYPNAPAEGWEPYRELYPELFGETKWRLLNRAYLLRAGVTVLVDTAVGPPGLWGWEEEQAGSLPRSLEALGVEPADVDVVFLTHVHADHVGWNADAEGEPLFSNARYLIHPEALAPALARTDAPHVERCLRSLTRRGLVDDVGPDEEIADGVRTVDLPGHAPGHLGLRIGDEARLIADAAPHPALLAEPEWVFRFDSQAEQAIETRRRVVEELVDSELLCACGHYPEGGVGRVRRRNGRVVWEPAS